jgi:hypothetical protein
LTPLIGNGNFDAVGKHGPVNHLGVDNTINESVAASAALPRRSIHIVQLIGIGNWISTFYISLFRFRLIPRTLALAGLLGISAEFVGVTAMLFLVRIQ